MSIQACGPDGTLWTAIADGGWRNGVGARMTGQEMERHLVAKKPKRRFVVIAMDGQGNVDFRDGQQFSTEEVAKRVAADMNVAVGEQHEWFYMVTPSLD